MNPPLSNVTFLPRGVRVSVRAGTALLDAAGAAGVRIDAPCGGEGSCGECRVKVEAGEVERAGGCLGAPEAGEGWALACSSRVRGDVTVRVPEISESLERIVTEGAGVSPGGPVEPLAERRRLRVEPPSLENSFSDLEQVQRALEASGGPREASCRLAALRDLAMAVRAREGEVTVTVLCGGDAAPPEILRIEPGDTTGEALGLAIDIGTTTCAVQLVDLKSGRVAATAAGYNGQIQRGLDVISRINYARVPARREELRSLVLGTLNDQIGELCRSRGVPADRIDGAVVAGNTTMVHLFLGLDPEHIRVDPYTPTVNRPPLMRAREVGLEIPPEAAVAFAPGVGSYVGGDITAGLIGTALAGGSAGVRLFLDIGTNGEVVLGSGEWLMACACSAGPAFEGAGIGCGMRASAGAIERVRIDRETGRAAVSVVGGGKPRGICGSGMIDLVSELWLARLVDPSGKFDPARRDVLRPAEDSGRGLSYEVVSAEESEKGESISICESDLQNLLRTKAAVFAACSLMLRSAGLEVGDVEQVYVAGGFGRFLDLRKAIAIGMLPDLPLERFAYLGNSSLAGARAMLTSLAARRKAEELARRITYLELNTDPSYMDEFTGALFLPHTDGSRFPTARALYEGSGRGEP